MIETVLRFFVLHTNYYTAMNSAKRLTLRINNLYIFIAFGIISSMMRVCIGLRRVSKFTTFNGISSHQVYFDSIHVINVCGVDMLIVEYG